MTWAVAESGGLINLENYDQVATYPDGPPEVDGVANLSVRYVVAARRLFVDPEGDVSMISSTLAEGLTRDEAGALGRVIAAGMMKGRRIIMIQGVVDADRAAANGRAGRLASVPEPIDKEPEPIDGGPIEEGLS